MALCFMHCVRFFHQAKMTCPRFPGIGPWIKMQYLLGEEIKNSRMPFRYNDINGIWYLKYVSYFRILGQNWRRELLRGVTKWHEFGLINRIFTKNMSIDIWNEKYQNGSFHRTNSLNQMYSSALPAIHLVFTKCAFYTKWSNLYGTLYVMCRKLCKLSKI